MEVLALWSPLRKNLQQIENYLAYFYILLISFISFSSFSLSLGIKQLNESSLDSHDTTALLSTSSATTTSLSTSTGNEKSNDKSTSSDRSTSENISSLSQYITENESFGTRTRGMDVFLNFAVKQMVQL